MYNQLLNEKSASKVDLRVLERKNIRLSERNFKLEEDIKKHKALLIVAESRIRMIEDEIANANSSRYSINNSSRITKMSNIKKTIKGGRDSSRASYV